MDWDNLYTARSPYVPRVEHELDTQNFEQYEEVQSKSSPNENSRRRTDPNFIGYTFKNFEAVQSEAGEWMPRPNRHMNSTLEFLAEAISSTMESQSPCESKASWCSVTLQWLQCL